MGDTGFLGCFATLAGEWQLIRSISSGEKLEGTCVFDRRDDHSLLATESGELQIADGSIINAHRQWVWQAENDALNVYFPEKPLRLYHRVNLSLVGNTWTGSGHHDCAPDTYLGEYEISPENLIVRQEISGPKKDYRIYSRYSRS